MTQATRLLKSKMSTNYNDDDMEFQDFDGDFIYSALRPVGKTPPMVSILDLGPELENSNIDAKDPSPRSKFLDSLPDLESPK